MTARSDDYIKNMIRRMLVEEGWTKAPDLMAEEAAYWRDTTTLTIDPDADLFGLKGHDDRLQALPMPKFEYQSPPTILTGRSS